MSNAVKTEIIDEALIIEYLCQHKDFFQRHEELLLKLSLPHPVSGKAISLIERQIELLRAQNKHLENKLMGLVQIACENERLSTRLHAFASNLLETRSISDVLAVTEEVMRDVFDTDFFAIRLLSSVTDDILLVIDEETESDLFAEFFTHNKPQCGQLDDIYIRYFFKQHMEFIESSAIIPLKSVSHLGVLALGSADAARFAADMGHLFLTHIGDLVSSALAVHIHDI